jgi:hypothetical protein
METKISYDLRLKEGVGQINLGMNRQEIKSILGEPESSSQGDLSIKDRYTSIGLHICYKLETEICEAIEVLDNVELMFRGGNILDLRWDNMFQWMLENDAYLDVRRGTYISYKLGIAAGPEYDEDLDDEIQESILIFSEGYWPSEEEMQIASKKRIDAMPSLEEMAKELGLEAFLETE